jgi:hypothetical protein
VEVRRPEAEDYPLLSELRCAALPQAAAMRDLYTIDSKLLAAVRRSIREHGGEPSSRQVDELLDERLAHRSRAGAFANGKRRVINYS